MCFYRSLLVFSFCFFTDISQGSVATHLRCDGIFSYSTMTNFFLILTVKKFENRSIFDEVIRRTRKCAIFLGHPVGLTQCETSAWCVCTPTTCFIATWECSRLPPCSSTAPPSSPPLDCTTSTSAIRCRSRQDRCLYRYVTSSLVRWPFDWSSTPVGLWSARSSSAPASHFTKPWFQFRSSVLKTVYSVV